MRQVDSLKTAIEDGTGGRVADLRPYTRGHNSDLYLVDMKDGRRLVAKCIREGMQASLETESWMLTYLAENTQLPVPRLHFHSANMIVMDFVLDSGVLDDGTQIHAADLLAALHSVTASQFGLERDTVLGPFIQPNTQSGDWITFFCDMRLLHMAKAAMGEGLLSSEQYGKIEKLAVKLGDLINPRPVPGLLHGDIWSGNVLVGRGRINAFIDPALYYGDREAELAFISLFDTFGEPFFRRYNERYALSPGFFRERRDIYNLYPLLSHARLYGSHYIKAAMEIVDRYT